MKYRMFGATKLKVSEIGFGCWEIGGTSYGKTDDKVSINTLNLAYDKGINFFDTADTYGDGHSEELLGKIFKTRRNKVIIATKGGGLPHKTAIMPKCFEPEYIRQALDKSLKRLNTDYVDLYQLHCPHIENLTDDLLVEIEKLYAEGKIRYFGISAPTPQEALNMINIRPDSIQFNFSMMDQRAIDCNLFHECLKEEIGIIIRTPLCFGYLNGKMTGKEKFEKQDHRNFWTDEQKKRWADGAKKLNTNTVKAIKYCLMQKEVSTVIPGMMYPEELLENIQAVEAPPIPVEEIKRIRELYENNEYFQKGSKI